MKILIPLLLIILISGCTVNNALEGPYLVTYVVDGDTLDLDNRQRIRLSEINY